MFENGWLTINVVLRKVRTDTMPEMTDSKKVRKSCAFVAHDITNEPPPICDASQHQKEHCVWCMGNEHKVPRKLPGVQNEGVVKHAFSLQVGCRSRDSLAQEVVTTFGLLSVMGSPDFPDRWWSSETVAVVTGGNKGLGFEIVRRLALEGLTVILTARNERRGLQSTRELHDQGLQNVVFRTLDISSLESVEDFADWLRYTYGGLDILVNNAAIFRDNNNYESAVETLEINYQGTISVIEKLLPMFKASPAGARIIIMSSWAGRLASINDENLRQQLVDESEFDQDFVDSVAQRYLQVCRTGNGGPNGYTNNAYRFSKVLINAYSRLLAERLANRPEGHKIFLHNVHPGFVHTDMLKKLIQSMDHETYTQEVARGRFGNEELIGVEEGADTPVWLCLVPHLPSGLLWSKRQVMSYT